MALETIIFLTPDICYDCSYYLHLLREFISKDFFLFSKIWILSFKQDVLVGSGSGFQNFIGSSLTIKIKIRLDPDPGCVSRVGSGFFSKVGSRVKIHPDLQPCSFKWKHFDEILRPSKHSKTFKKK